MSTWLKKFWHSKITMKWKISKLVPSLQLRRIVQDHQWWLGGYWLSQRLKLKWKNKINKTTVKATRVAVIRWKQTQMPKLTHKRLKMVMKIQSWERYFLTPKEEKINLCRTIRGPAVVVNGFSRTRNSSSKVWICQKIRYIRRWSKICNLIRRKTRKDSKFLISNSSSNIRGSRRIRKGWSPQTSSGSR